MSADNWAICPKCLRRAELRAAAARATVNSAYGTIPVEEWEARKAELVDVDPEEHRTFREDYEIYGAETGEITVSYAGRCTECGIGTEIRDTRSFWTPDPI